MNQGGYTTDLVVLAADKDSEMALRGILSRPQSLRIHEVTVEYLVHSDHDPACARESHEVLRPLSNTCAHGLVILDHHGSGYENMSRADLEGLIEHRLATNGWTNRAAALVISPELENWVWSNSPEIPQVLGWPGTQQEFRDWLHDKGLWLHGHPKPQRPKEAMQDTLRRVQKPWSSSIHRRIAERVSLRRCSDPAFQKLREVLQNWFAAD